MRARVPRRIVPALLLSCAIGAHAESLLTLERAEALALEADPGGEALAARAGAARDRAVAAGELPDPEVTVAGSNFPVDTLAFDQEPMTQLRVAVRQRFPGRGERALSGERERVRGRRFEALEALRRREVRRNVRSAWIELARQHARVALLERARPLLVDLEATARAE